MLRGWRLFFLLYVLILSISFIFELTRSDHKQTIISSGTSNNTALTLLFFPDLEGNSSTLDCLKSSLKNRFQILEVDYDEIEFDTADYSASQYAESIKQYVPDIKKIVSTEKPFGLGLRLSNKASEELDLDQALQKSTV